MKVARQYSFTFQHVSLQFSLTGFFYIIGSDGIQLDYVNIRTDNRLLNCPLGVKLDDDEFYSVMCSTTKNYNK